MSSEIRVDTSKNTSGLCTVTYSNTGAVLSGITTFSGNQKIQIDSSGTIGINTTSPSRQLEVFDATQGTIAIKSGDAGQSSLWLSDSDINIGGVYYEHNNNALGIRVNDDERLRIDSSGRLLLGTTTEGHANADDLTVSSSGDTGITIRSGTSSGGRIYFSDATSGTGEYQGKFEYIHSDNSFRFATATNEAFRITSDGYLKLAGTISGSDNKLGRFLMPSHDSGEEDVMYMQFQQEDTFNQLEFGGGSSSYNAATKIIFRTAAVDTVTGVERLQIDSSGNVYVGGVGASATAGSLWLNDTSAHASKIWQDNGNSALVFGTGSGQAERFKITSGGNALFGGTAVSQTNRQLVVGSNTEANLAIETHNTSASETANIRFYRSRGTAASPTTLVDDDVISNLLFYGHDGTDYANAAAMIRVECDGTVAGNQMPGALSFYTNSGTTSPTERLRIRPSGQVDFASRNFTMGTQSDTGSTVGIIGNAWSNNEIGIKMSHKVSGGQSFFVFYNTNGQVGYIQSSGSGTIYNTGSDYRLKENQVLISDGITRLKQLKPYRFNFKKDPSTTLDGFFAHEVQSVVPEAIAGTKDEVATKDEGDRKKGDPILQGMDYGRITPLLTAALQEAIAKIEVLETKVAALESS